ncbi:hypothetical protein KQ940_21645 [Marinobacterium sp. D7]|uniref:hypothetical protein n=1 Tax=Marinobacterium ramblicola TaxID=2849041 RepID=UPI001C2D8484|nr:hypothetical protein [Marinobacterium ramblicola]MBV1790673.1 hypothetical protein [Marinobacterium ramblicola]
MWKHVFASSIQAAFVGGLVLVLLSSSAFGSAAVFFGFFAFPIAFCWCVIFAYPMIRIRQKYRMPEWSYFLIYLIAGFVLGAITPVFVFSVSVKEFSFQAATFLGLYGVIGSISAITAWNYIRRNVAL